ncbi:hypothetical protein BT96DRAFT_1043294 [Gymnopus androsaceus JB14]|uniref:Uncharacterized protein n=1 Tax=Gymnopus androsaceus JB14 TaxID=1447944 RepID=A0A6A4HCK5_9AGAR|nr:hypothetical protein BT96DRAFT_1043294 [Gymnopus androsaceus JB14]
MNQKVYPNLSKLAISIHSIPGMCSSTVFSFVSLMSMLLQLLWSQLNELFTWLYPYFASSQPSLH